MYRIYSVLIEIVAAAVFIIPIWCIYTSNFYTCTKEILSCLGQMYVGDKRFMQHIDGHGAGTATFMAAIEIYTR